MTIYISGAITGDNNYKEKFQKAKKDLEAFINAPHTKGRKTTRADYIKTVWDLSKKLAEAKELLKRWERLYNTNTVKGIIADTKNFLKESE